MRNRTRALIGIVAMVGAGVTTAGAAGPSLRGKVRIDGSSTVYPITEAVAEEFAEEAPRVRVTVGISGTGGGFKRFTTGETDISDASRPIRAAEWNAARSNGVEFIEIPVAYDGLSIVVNKSNWQIVVAIEKRCGQACTTGPRPIYDYAFTLGIAPVEKNSGKKSPTDNVN